MKKVIVIGGPTAAGKTALAIQLAKVFHCDIISADSRQFYREMTIGTAKPSREELNSVTHHFIDSLSIHDDYDVNRYETQVNDFLNDYFEYKDCVIAIGGSGLYLDALINGLDSLPKRDENIRRALETEWKEKGIIALQQKLTSLDPLTASTIDIMNPVRLIRAIEICLLSGQPASSQRTGKKIQRNYNFILTAICPAREILYSRINQRVDQMIVAGLVDEVRTLHPYRNLPALNTVGYTELFDFLEGNTSLDKAIELIKQHTRNYAKRQLTWFRNRGDYRWFDPSDTATLVNFIATK
jgi:tRNA dimethylallyltransferase